MASLQQIVTTSLPPAAVCLSCKGARMLCGKLRCPLIARAVALSRIKPLVNSENIEGSCPPGVFVGRFGYPRVSVGPLIPPYYGDTELLDTPEMWVGRSIDEIIGFRTNLIRCKIRATVVEPQIGNAAIERFQELAMGLVPAEAEAKFLKKPRLVLSLSEESQPFGPSALLKEFWLGNVKADSRIEKAYYDTDLKATDAVIGLYSNRVMVTRIQRAFSMGMFGWKKRRRLVPTRWSITAVDDIISKTLVKEVKNFETIDKHRVYAFRHLDNLFVAIIIPGVWAFEWIEAWFPGTTWNATGSSPAMMGDYEGYFGRRTYAKVGGCYYSARLAAAEKLKLLRKQASILILREIHPGYILPVGVWNVREGVRATFRAEPEEFDTFEAAWRRANEHLTISSRFWVEQSRMIRLKAEQMTLSAFCKASQYAVARTVFG